MKIILSEKVRGSYTVEAVFIVTICVWVLMAILYCGLYIHDRIVLSSTVNEETAAWLASGDMSEAQWKKEMRECLERKLFLFTICDVSDKTGWNTKTVTVRYSIPVTEALLKHILSENKVQPSYETKREDIEPARYKWNAILEDLH